MLFQLLSVLPLLSLAAANCMEGETTVDAGYQYTCMADEDGFTYEMASGCVSPADQTVKAGGEVFQDDFYVYECQILEDMSVGLEIVGCVSNGATIEEGGKVEIGDYIHTCARSDGGYLQVVPSGCNVDGGEVPIGETFDQGSFWYTCSGPEPLVMQLGGCVSPAGDRLNNGEIYFKNGFVVTCQCTDDACKHTVTGCEELNPAGSKPRAVGEEWLQGAAPFQYKAKCSTCSQGTTVVRTLPYCIEGDLKIEPGCMSGGVGCGTNEQQTLQMISGSSDELSAQGFNQC